MQPWSIEAVRRAMEERFSAYPALRIAVEKLFVTTTENHVLDVYGQSEYPDKVKGGSVICINALPGEGFGLYEIKLLYAGEVVERESFQAETWDYSTYEEVVRNLEEKAREYTPPLAKGATARYIYRSYVVIEQPPKGVPIIKWITIDQVYESEETYIGSGRSIEEICSYQPDGGSGDDELLNIYRLLCVGEDRNCYHRIEKVFVKADIVCELYGKEQEIRHIEQEFLNYAGFLETLRELEKEVLHINLKRRWMAQENVDIDKLDRVAELVTMEVYFATGFIIPYNGTRRERGNLSFIKYLHESKSLEAYIGILTQDLTEAYCKSIREAVWYLKEHAKEEPEEIVYRFIKPHLNGSYELGKVYFAKVIKECLDRTDTDRDGLVRLHDEETHYRFVKRLLYEEYVFMDYALRDYPPIVQLEYGSGMWWSGAAVLDAYLKENIYEEDGKLRPHGWEDENIPVKLVGYGKGDMPIVEYAEAWHH